MIWPLAASLFISIGGILAIWLAPAHTHRSSVVPFDAVTAFIITVGVISLWPLVVALHLADRAPK